MGKVVFHPSVEGAQHGPKGLVGFLEMAKRAGAVGAQPSNFMVEGMDPGEIWDIFSQRGLHLDGISAHCPFWVHTTAWTGSKTIRPFIPEDMRRASVEEIEQWAEDYILRLLDKCAALGVKVIPMFWGLALGPELGMGYPWGLPSGPGYDLVEEGTERFIEKTRKIRKRARDLEILLAHEIHPGTAAVCADDLLYLVWACDHDSCMGVNADPSHCWEGEDWVTRFEKVGKLVVGCHVKNHHIIPGLPLRSMESRWQNRGMQFTDLRTGDINLRRYAELMVKIGYPQRYCALMQTETAPLVVEAESAYEDGDQTSINGVAYVKEELCFQVAIHSFEEGMGATR